MKGFFKDSCAVLIGLIVGPIFISLAVLMIAGMAIYVALGFAIDKLLLSNIFLSCAFVVLTPSNPFRFGHPLNRFFDVMSLPLDVLGVGALFAGSNEPQRGKHEPPFKPSEYYQKGGPPAPDD